jgi:hypothetical protein
MYIIVNSKPWTIDGDFIDYELAVLLAGKDVKTLQTVTYTNKQGNKGTLVPGQQLRITEAMRFNVDDTNNA